VLLSTATTDKLWPSASSVPIRVHRWLIGGLTAAASYVLGTDLGSRRDGGGVARGVAAVAESLSANPDRPAARGIGATAARPSCEIARYGCGAPPVLEGTRCYADSAAPRSPGVSADPSRRDTARIAGSWSAPGKDFNSAAALADSADGGSCRGALSAPGFDPMSTMKTPAPAAINSAITHERRCVAAAAMRSHAIAGGRLSPGARSGARG